MLPVGEAFLAESMRDGNQPVLFMDIWADKGPRRTLANSSDWSGSQDPAVASDINVSATRIKGALVLSQGASVPITGSGFTSLSAHVMNYAVTVQDHGHSKSVFGGGSWVHEYFSSLVTNQDPPILRPFISSSTFIADSIRIVAQNTGNSTTSITVRIVDSKGNQVGNMSSVAVNAASGQVTLDIVGLSASLIKGAKYQLELSYTFPAAPGVVNASYSYYTVNLIISSYAIGAYAHNIDFGAGNGFVIGGSNGFQASGSASRTMDVREVPIGSGVITFSDVVPGGADPTSMIITLYYTDSAAIAAQALLTNWTLHGQAASGDALTAHRYWRARIDMTSNSLNDETPELIELTISFIGDPITFAESTHVDLINGATDVYQVSARPGLESVSMASAQLTPKPSKSMIGRVSVTLLPEPSVNGLMNKPLRGRLVRIRAGFVGIAETIEFYTGIVRDMSYSHGKYKLTLNDVIELADVQVPRTKAGLAWSSVTDYAVANPPSVVIYGTNSWNAIGASGPANGGAVMPGTNALIWQDNGTVWQDIGYTAATNGGVDWHLADIAKDLIINRINIQSQHVDFDSLAAAKLSWPGRTGSRVLTKPTKAFEMLSELAWLLESQWAVRNSQLTLIPEPNATDTSVESVSAHDIQSNPGYRRGWADLKNESLIVSGYSGVGDSNAQFHSGEAVADAASISQYGLVSLDVFKDKWNVPTLSPTSTPVPWTLNIGSVGAGAWVSNAGVVYTAIVGHATNASSEPGVASGWGSLWKSDELMAIATHFVNRWKNGRRVISGAKTQMRLLRTEPGDVVMFDSIDLPPGDPGPYKVMVLKKDIDWKRQTLNQSFIEVN